MVALARLLYWLVLYGMYWPARLVYFELPRACWRGYQRWQARRRITAAHRPPFTTPPGRA